MTAKEVIRAALDQSAAWLEMLVSDMKTNALAYPTPRGGNHPLWVLGHLVTSEASMTAGFILGEQNPLARWDALFGMGSQPTADASQYPSWDELVQTSKSVRAATLKLLDSYTDADLSKPSKAPPEYGLYFGSVGKVFLMVANHAFFHAGQVADARRAVGKPPAMG